MSKLHVYDNWERLVDAVIDREKLRRLAFCDSFSSTSSSAASTPRFNSISSSSRISFNFAAAATNVNFIGNAIWAKPIQLTDQVIKAADDAASFKEECAALRSKTDKLGILLRKGARAGNNLYERPARRIISNTEQVLAEALSLVLKCRGNGLVRVFTVISSTAFRKMSSLLENSIGDVSWLVRISASSDDDNEYIGLPPIAAGDPLLCLIWEQIAILYTSNVDDHGDAAASLAALARDNDRYGKLIIEEGGVAPLLKLVKEGKLEGQEIAAMAIGLLGKDRGSVEHMIDAGVCSVFAKLLEAGPMKVQAAVGWAVSELVANYPNCQDMFVEYRVMQLLIRLFVFETVLEHSKYGGVKANRAREMESPATKVYLKAMAARALWHLAKGNKTVCQRIAETQALLCFAVLLEKGQDEVQLNSAMALMEITAFAEEDSEFRRNAFRPNSPACKAVIDQLLRIIEIADSDDLLVPCIKAIGNLARAFRATETRMINPLVRLLDEREAEVSKEACIALTKFACSDNYLHLDHSKAIIGAGGAKYLVQLVYFEPKVQSKALVLLSYIALHVPDSEELTQAEVLAALEWASQQAVLMQVEEIERLVPEAKEKLDLYELRGYQIG